MKQTKQKHNSKDVPDSSTEGMPNAVLSQELLKLTANFKVVWLAGAQQKDAEPSCACTYRRFHDCSAGLELVGGRRLLAAVQQFREHRTQLALSHKLPALQREPTVESHSRAGIEARGG